MPTCCKSQTGVISWNACHFQTVTPIPMIFILFSSDFIPSIQWHTWFSKLRPGSCISCHILHFASRIAFHISYHHFIILLGLARGWLYPCCLFVLLGRARRRVRYRGARWVCLWGSSQLWQLCMQDDHTLEITTIFATLVCSLLLCQCYDAYLLLVSLPIAMLNL